MCFYTESLPQRHHQELSGPPFYSCVNRYREKFISETHDSRPKKAFSILSFIAPHTTLSRGPHPWVSVPFPLAECVSSNETIRMVFPKGHPVLSRLRHQELCLALAGLSQDYLFHSFQPCKNWSDSTYKLTCLSFGIRTESPYLNASFDPCLVKFQAICANVHISTCKYLLVQIFVGLVRTEIMKPG